MTGSRVPILALCTAEEKQLIHRIVLDCRAMLGFALQQVRRRVRQQ